MAKSLRVVASKTIMGMAQALDQILATTAIIQIMEMAVITMAKQAAKMVALEIMEMA